jgi:Mor family transcriptional regulator
MITLENIADIISKSKDNKNYPLEYLSKLYNVTEQNIFRILKKYV